MNVRQNALYVNLISKYKEGAIYMKKTISKFMCITVCSIMVFAMISGCGKKEAKKSKEYTSNDIYSFRVVSDVEKDIYYINAAGVEMTKRQYDNLFNYYDRTEIYTLTEEECKKSMDDDDLTGVFNYENDKKTIGTFGLFGSINKIEADVYKNTDEKSEKLNRNGAVEQAMNEVEYEPVDLRTAYDSDNNMWRVSLYYKDNGEEAVYINVYMTEKGKTELVTQVYKVLEWI